MMTWPNPAAWTELEARQEVLHRKLSLLNQFVEIPKHQGAISWEIVESSLAEIESTLADSEALDTATKNRRAAAG